MNTTLETDNGEALEDILADAADELRGIQMFSLAAGVEKARRLLSTPSEWQPPALTPEQLRTVGAI